MRIPEKELERLKQSESFVKSHFPHFGINKKQEITRLLYEISKREKISPFRVLSGGIIAKSARLRHPERALRPQAGSNGTVVEEYGPDFESLKKYLLERRFPFASGNESSVCAYLPRIELDPSDALTLPRNNFSPSDIFIEKDCRDSFLVRRLAQIFPRAKLEVIISLKEHLSSRRGFQIKDYNNRRKSVFVIKQKYDFLKSCPCTKFSLPCAYQVFNLGFGCIYECAYCFLQEYTNCPGIVLPANLDSYFDAFPLYKRNRMRIGTGEFSDSLALDEVTNYSMPIIEFFRKYPAVTFEFKTKSNCVDNLLQAKHAGNIVVSWSLNPQKIIRDNEHLTAALSERLKSAARCVQAGYKIGIHFDPVIYFHGWKKEYALLVELVFEKIKPGNIAWISIGTFRFSPSLKKIIENRFPGNKILDEELLKGYDGKLRYPYNLRLEIYRAISSMLLKHSKKLVVYLCMEEARMWKDAGLRMPEW